MSLFRYLAALLFFVPVSGCGRSGAQPSRPNIVLVLADDLGWRDLGVMGSTYYRTPHIDRLAATGLRFTSAYANAPNCAPSRASLLTGRYTPRHGVYTVASSARGRAEDRKLIPIPNETTLDTGFVTLAEVLSQLGYTTGHFGKWHLGGDGALPEDQGFDVNVAGGPQGAPASYFYPYGKDPEELARAGLTGAEGDYLTHRLTDAALSFIRTHADGPFFLYLPHYAVHTPIQAPDSITAYYHQREPDEQHDNPVYAAMIHTLDQSVGRVVSLLDSLGIADNTVVIFFSDNGGHGPTTGMRPLRGAKGMLYEGGIRVPLIIRYPKMDAEGEQRDVPVIGLDLFPTIIELAGGSPQQVANDGLSLLPVLQGGRLPEREALYWHFPAYLEAYRGGLSTTPWRTTPAGAIRMGDWKLIEFFEDGSVELYHLSEDIGEQRDVSDQFSERAEAMRSRLASWRERTGAPVPTQPNPAYEPRR